MRISRATIAITSVLVPLLATGCAFQHGSSDQDCALASRSPNTVSLSPQLETAIRIKLAVVQDREVDATVNATGELMPNANTVTRVSSPLAGRVVETCFSVGDRVKAGNTVASVSSQEVQTLEADLFQREAEVDTELTKQLADIQFDLDKEQEELKLAKKQLDRVQLLVSEQIGSQAALDAAATAYEEARMAVQALKVKRQRLKEIAVRKQQLYRQAARNKLKMLGIPDNEIAAIIDNNKVDSVILLAAPRSGVVLERCCNVGELVDENKNLFVIDDLDRLWLVADIFEQDIGRVHVGQPVECTVDSFPDQVFHGHILWMAESVNSDTRTLAVRAEIPNPDHKLKPKMFARIRILCESRKAPVIPKSAVQDAGSTKVVFVPLGCHVYEQRTVEVGGETGEYIEVRKGLRSGEKVVAEGGFELRSQLLRRSR